MKESDPAIPPSGAAEQGAELAMQRCVTARLTFWAVVAGLPLLLVIAYQTRQLSKLRHELETLRAESVRIGQPVEIYNPSWAPSSTEWIRSVFPAATRDQVTVVPSVTGGEPPIARGF